jgi:hypothetical protein
MQVSYNATLLGQVERNLKHVSTANLVDLLKMTISYTTPGLARDATEMLLRHDRDTLHFLHTAKLPPDDVVTSAASPAGQMEGADAVATVQINRDHEAAQHIVQLMEACAVRGHMHLLARLAGVPAAQEIGKNHFLLSLMSLAVERHLFSMHAQSSKTCS